jgi:hypothetical protein
MRASVVSLPRRIRRGAAEPHRRRQGEPASCATDRWRRGCGRVSDGIGQERSFGPPFGRVAHQPWKVWIGQTAQSRGSGPFAAEAGQRMNPAVLAVKRPRPMRPRRCAHGSSMRWRRGSWRCACPGTWGRRSGNACVRSWLTTWRAQFEQHLRDVDFDRADFVAGAAERGGVGQRLRVLHLHQLRREDGADGAGIDRAVGVAAGLAVDGAGVHAGGAADALEGLALDLGRRGWRRATVVEQNDMEALAGRRLG